MKLIILILVIIILAYITYDASIFITEPFTQCDYDHGSLNVNDLTDLKNLLIKLTEFFTTQNITYFGDGGTALGTIRSGGLLPFDDDIDLGIFQSDATLEKIDDYNDVEYYFEPIYFGYKFKRKNSKLFIDIMVYQINEDNIKYEIINNSWPDHYINKTEIYPLIIHKYSDIDMPLLNKCKERLDRTYPDWETTIKLDCGHGDEIRDTSTCINAKMGLPTEFNVNDYDKKYACYVPFPS